MPRTALIYGSIAGSITIAVMCLGFILDSDGTHGASSAIFGYATMIVALTMIFIGVKRYRDQTLGGVIKFGPAFGLGLAIAVIAAFFYATGWEIYLAATGYAFAPDYAQSVIAKREAAGLSGAELEALKKMMEGFVKNYENPFYRFPLTMTEILPVGLIVALISAALLRNPKMLPARG